MHQPRVAPRARRAALLAAASCIVLGASVLEARASCPAARVVSSFPSRIYTPGFPFTGGLPPEGGSVTLNAHGVFWSFGAFPGGGNPAVGPGHDSGAASGANAESWFYLGYAGYGGHYYAALGGNDAHWAAPLVNGCIDVDGSHPFLPDLDQCMVVLLTDDDGQGRGYFALLSVPPDTFGDYYLSVPAVNGPITLGRVPEPRIVGAEPSGSTTFDVEVRVSAEADPAHGFYLKCRAPALVGQARYRVYARTIAAGEPFPTEETGRAPSNWSFVGGPFPLGEPAIVSLGLDAAHDTYLCSTLEFPAGNGNYFETSYCSQNSIRLGLPLLCPDADLDAHPVCHAGCDGAGLACDCADTDPTVWSMPGDVGALHAFTTEKMCWSAPIVPGGLAPTYDTVRSLDPSDFIEDGVCVEAGASNDTCFATEPVPPGVTYFYLVRAETACGPGPAGHDSSGIAREARTCR
jgi:hypothetical protein